MKILVLSNDAGGLYKFRKELLAKLCEDNNVVVCCPFSEYVNRIKQIGCKYISQELNRRSTNPFDDLKLLIGYIEIIKKIRPEVVLTYTIKPNVYGGLACQMTKTPYITNITGLGTAVENGGVMGKFTLALYKLGLRKAKKVFFQNAENRDFMLKHNVVKGKYDLLPGSGVNLSQYTIQPYPNEDTIDFVFIARVMKEKGIDQYLNAAKVIRKRHPETRFHICGYCEGDYEDILRELNDNGTIIYHGVVDDMNEIYKMVSCTVHPTYYPEGLSNVLLESAASGRPIITTDRSGCREVVDNNINGFVVKPKNSKDLIEKIESFLQLNVEERKLMGLAGRTKVEKQFNRQIVIDKYIKELHSI